LAFELCACSSAEEKSELLEIVAEGVIGGEEEPGVVAGLDHGGGGAVGERVIVVGVMDRHRRARLVGDAHRGGPVEHDDLVLVFGDFDRGERRRGGRDVHERVDVLGVEPFPRDIGGIVRLVLMIRGDDLDRLAQHLAAEILGRHPGRGHCADAGDVGIEARHVLDHPDLHHAVGDLFLRLGTQYGRERHD